MMTTLQLGARLVPYFDGITALHDLPVTATNDLVDAINLGLSEFLSDLAPHRMKATESWFLRAPVDQPISIVHGAKGFSYTDVSAYPKGGYESQSDAVGHSAVVSGDGQLNRLNRSGELLAGYLGVTGTPTMTIYGDAVGMSEDAQQIVSEIHVVDASGTVSQMFHRDEAHGGAGLSDESLRFVSIGQPRYWWTASHRGSESTASPLWHLRVWPLPGTAYSVKAECKTFPSMLTFEDLSTARRLPITAEEQAILKAIIAVGFRTMANLAKHIDKEDLERAATRARIRLKEMKCERRDTATQTLKTKPGY